MTGFPKGWEYKPATAKSPAPKGWGFEPAQPSSDPKPDADAQRQLDRIEGLTGDKPADTGEFVDNAKVRRSIKELPTAGEEAADETRSVGDKALDRSPVLSKQGRENAERLERWSAGVVAKAQKERRGGGNYRGFDESVVSGVNDLGMLGAAFLEAVGEGTGWEGLAKAGEHGRKKFTGKNAEIDEALGGAGEFTGIRSLGDALGWAGQTSGRLIPVMVPGVLGSVATGGAGTIGATAGAFVPSAAMGVGEVQVNMKEKDEESEADAWVFLGGSAIGALDSLLPGQVGGKLVKAFGRESAEEIALRAFLRPAASTTLGKAATNAGGAALKGMATEGLTESLQEAIGEVFASKAAQQEIDWESLPHAMIEAGAAGALFGGGISTATSAISDVNARAIESEAGRIYDAENNAAAVNALDPSNIPLSEADKASALPDSTIQAGKAKIAEMLGEDPFTGEKTGLSPIDVAAAPVIADPAPEPAQAQEPVRTAKPAPVEGGRKAFMDRVRQVESGGKDRAKNPRSSASGRYQFIQSTWESLGGNWADRFDVNEQERLMNKLTDQNEAALKRAGVPLTEGNYYLAHFAGSGGAVNLHRNPNGSARDILGAAVIKANPFLKGMTGQDVIDWAAKKMGGKAPPRSTTAPDGSTTPLDLETDPLVLDDSKPESAVDMLKDTLGSDILDFKSGETVQLTENGKSVSATIDEMWEEDGVRGVRIEREDGTFLDQSIEEFQAAGNTVAKPAPVEEVGNQDDSTAAPVAEQPAADVAALTGEVIDKKYTRFSDTSGSIGIPRADMPQIKSTDRGALANFLKGRGIEYSEVEVPANSLKPSQAEFSPAKVQQAKEFEGGNRALLISSDNHLIDGHHQWLAAVEAGEDVRAIQVDAPIREALTAAAEFPSSEVSETSQVLKPDSVTDAQLEASVEQAPTVKMEETSSGKGIAVIGASPAQLAAIQVAVPKAKPSPPRNSDGGVVYSKKHAEAIREALAATETTDTESFDSMDVVAVVDANNQTRNATAPAAERDAFRMGAQYKMGRYRENGSEGPLSLPTVEQINEALENHEEAFLAGNKAAKKESSRREANREDGSNIVEGKQEDTKRGPNVPEGVEIDDTRMTTKQEKEQSGATFTAVASRQSPFQSERGYGNSAFEAGADAVRRLDGKGKKSTKAEKAEIRPAIEPSDNSGLPNDFVKQDVSTEPDGNFTIVKGFNAEQRKHVAENHSIKFKVVDGGIRIKNDDMFMVEPMIREAGYYKPTSKATKPESAKAAHNRAANVYRYLAGKGTQQITSPYINHKQWLQSQLEQADNPNRFDRVQEAENPLGLKVGDRVIDKGAPDRETYVVSLTKDRIKTANVDSYSGWSDYSNFEKYDGGPKITVSDTLADGSSVAEAAATAKAVDAKAAALKAAQDSGRLEIVDARSKPKPAAYGANNKLVSQERADELRAKLKEKLNSNRLNSVGIDPELIAVGVELTVFHIEAGARKFSDYVKAISKDLEMTPSQLRPYVRGWYNGARDFMEDRGLDVDDMDGPGAVRAAMNMIEDSSSSSNSVIEGQQETTDGDATTAETTDGANQTGDEGTSAADVSGVEQPAGSVDTSAGTQSADGTGQRERGSEPSADGVQPSVTEPVTDGNAAGNDSSAQRSGADSDSAGNRLRGKPAERGSNFAAERGSLKRQGSWRDTASRNLDVVELVNKLDAENRPATAEEQKLLASFTGWGAAEIRNNLFRNISRGPEGRSISVDNWDRGPWADVKRRAAELLTGDNLETALQSTQYAHYTGEEVIRSIWSGVERLGFGGGRILEPGMGNGLFPVAAPAQVMDGSNYTGIELDAFSAKVAGYLLPQETIQTGDFTKTKLPDGFYDLAIGNPPFADVKVLSDPAYKKHRFLLHDYFFAKSIDKVRPGGLLVFVTSKGTMDKQGQKARQYIADRADLLGAIRLPQTAFKENAGTEVVTDILFLQRRAPDAEPAGQPWIGLDKVTAPDASGSRKTILVNEYFKANPDMVLGRHSLTSGRYGGDSYTVVPYKDSIESRLAGAIENLPQDQYSAAPKAAKAAAEAKTFERDFAPAHSKEGGIYLKDGEVLRVEDGSGVPLSAEVKISAKDKKWLAGYTNLRDLLKQAQKDQLQDGDWEPSHKKLVKAYDAFTKEHGPIKAFTTYERKSKDADGEEVVTTYRRYKYDKLLSLDVEGVLVEALEKITDEGEVIKGPFLLGRTLNKPTRPKVTTPQDALAVTLDEIGKVDLAYAGNLLGQSKEQMIEGLGDGLYQAPNGEWQTSDEYLSGDVLAKLDEAKVAAEQDERFERNVQALMAVQPKPLAHSDITVKLGAGWVSTDIIEDFASEVLESPSPVSYNPTQAAWTVANSNQRYRRSNTAEYGTKDRSALELLDAVLNNRTIKITYRDSDGKTHTDATATEEAVEVARKIEEKFKTWVWTDPKRAAELAEVYNSRFNNIAPRQFNGDHLTFPGLSSRFKMRPHQSRAIWRIMQTGNTYLAHAVGAGKTLEMIVSGMEMRRLGLVKKPMYTVPNHMLKQFSYEFLEAYPAANIMVADEKAFHTSNRKRFMAQVALNDPDAIIITHSSFKKIDTGPEARELVVQDMIEELEDSLEGADTRHSRSKIENQIEKLKQKFASDTDNTKKDKALTFEEMGVDFLYVDEAHEFRKLDYATNRTGKGIDASGSQMSMDLFIKTRWLEKQNPGRSMVMASGTPITNTMAELYTVMRFMDMEGLQADGLSHFDAWANMFGEMAAGLEKNAVGNYEIVTRFARFVNVADLMRRVRSFMDVLTNEQLGDLVKRPKIIGGAPKNIVTPAVPALQEYMAGELNDRLVASRNWKPSASEPSNPDPIIAINGDALLSSIDMRFIKPELPSDPKSKLNVMIDNIIETHNEGAVIEYVNPSTGKKDPRKGTAQIIFSPIGFGAQVAKSRGFSARDWIEKRLNQAGIKTSQIGWMSDANTHAKKEQLQKDVRSGKVRILFGSPKNMGTGLNVQQRLKYLHFLSPPWYPSDVEQPHGRIERQGNLNAEVDLRWYATEDTYEASAWGMVARKATFIQQALSGDDSVRVIEDISAVSQYEMAAALAAGDDRVIKMASLGAEIEKFERLRAAHADNQRSLKADVRYLEKSLPRLEGRIARHEAAIADRSDAPFSMEVGGKTFEKQGEAGEAILDAINQAILNSAGTPNKELGKYLGKHPVRMSPLSSTGESFTVEVKVGDVELEVIDRAVGTEDIDAGGLSRRITNAVAKLDEQLRGMQRELAEDQKRLKDSEERIGAPFAEEAKLTEAVANKAQLEAELAAEGQAKEDAAKAAAEPPKARDSVDEIVGQLEGRDAELVAELTKQMEAFGISDRVTLDAGRNLELTTDNAQGQYWNRVISVALDKSANPAATLAHETVHALKSLGMFTPAEWASLTKAAWADPDARAFAEGPAYDKLGLSGKKEEAAAEYFARHFQEMNPPKGNLWARAMKRILSFMAALAKAVHNVRGSEYPTGLAGRLVADKILSGEIGSREIGANDLPNGMPAYQAQTEELVSLGGNDPTWKGKAADLYDAWRTTLQDRFLPLLKVQRDIEQRTGKPLPNRLNPYLGEELMTGRVGAQMDIIENDMVAPLFDAMADLDVNIEDLETYLYARHAPERNAQIATINPEFEQGTGSGMTDSEAADVMAEVERLGKTKAMKILADRVDRLRDYAVDYRVKSGLMTQEDADVWRDTYENYIPLRGFKGKDALQPARVNQGGKGITVRGKESRRALGRYSKADAPVANLILQAQEAVMRGEKNRVAQRFVRMAESNPVEGFWEVQKITGRRQVNEDTGLVEEYLVHQLLAEDEPYTVVAKFEGKERRVTMNRDNPDALRLANSVRRLTEQQMDWFTQHLGKVNRFLSSVNTSWNPEFVITNAFRDIQTAVINLQGVDVEKITRGTLKDYKSAIVASTKGAFNKGEGEWREWYNEFVQQGGKVSFNHLEDLAKIKKNVDSALEMVAAKQGDGSARVHAKRAALAVKDAVEGVNSGVENAVRLAAYKNAREAGVGKEQAASIAKNLTVNFNRRGTAGPAINALYLFFNASLQGSVRIFTALKSPRVQKMMGAIVVFGMGLELLNAALSEDDEDGASFYDKVPAYEKSRNLIIMIPGTDGEYLKVPLPYGYNAVFGAGRTMAEIGRKGGKDWQKSIGHFAETVVDAFNPVGGTSSILNFVAPTIVDPVVDLTLNRDFADRPIMPDQPAFDSPDPDSQRYWGSVGTHWRTITDFLSSATGGDGVKEGAIEVSPETLEHLSGVVVGAAGASVDRLVRWGEKAIDPTEEVQANDIMFVRKLVGDKPNWHDKSTYYDRQATFDKHRDNTKDYLDNEMIDEARAYVDEHEVILSLEPVSKQAQKDMREIRKARRGIEALKEREQIDDATYRKEREIIDEAERRVIVGFNKAWNNALE